MTNDSLSNRALIIFPSITLENCYMADYQQDLDII